MQRVAKGKAALYITFCIEEKMVIMIETTVESLFGTNAGIVWKALIRMGRAT